MLNVYVRFGHVAGAARVDAIKGNSVQIDEYQETRTTGV